MNRARVSFSWIVSCVLWSAGVFLLWKAWKYQKTLPDPVGSFIEFTVMFVATFYIFMLIPIKCRMDDLFRCRRKETGGLSSVSSA